MLHDDRPENTAKQTAHGVRIWFGGDSPSNDHSSRASQVCRRILLHHCLVPHPISICLSTQCDQSAGNITLANEPVRVCVKAFGGHTGVALISLFQWSMKKHFNLGQSPEAWTATAFCEQKAASSRRTPKSSWSVMVPSFSGPPSSSFFQAVCFPDQIPPQFFGRWSSGSFRVSAMPRWDLSTG